MYSSTCIPQWMLIDVELDAGTELEVTQVSRQMARDRGERRGGAQREACGEGGGTRCKARARLHSARCEMQGCAREARARVYGARREMCGHGRSVSSGKDRRP
jgi:hypothetical protein